MEKILIKIITDIPRGYIFDSHTIISILIEKYSDIYLSSFCKGTTELYHSYIGQCIAKLDGKLVKQDGIAWSKNIHGEYSKCTSWIKL